MSEQQMTALVERVGESLDPDVARLVSGGVARGRTRRRRRVAGVALTGVASLGAVALAATLVPRGDADAGQGVADSVGPHRVVAVAPTDMDEALAALLPGARVARHDDVPYEFQRQHGTVRFRGKTVTVRIDSRSAGIAKSARTRCESAYDRLCERVGDAWLFEGGRSDDDSGIFDDLVVAYLPEGYVIEGIAGPGAMDRARLRELVLDDGWLRPRSALGPLPQRGVEHFEDP
jgi:hypothetical protein